LSLGPAFQQLVELILTLGQISHEIDWRPILGR